MATSPSAPSDTLDFSLYTPFLKNLGLLPSTLIAAGYDIASPGNVLLNNPDTFLSLLTADSEFANYLTIAANSEYQTIKGFATTANDNFAGIAKLLPKGSARQGGATSTGLQNQIWTALISATQMRFITSSGSKLTSFLNEATFLNVVSSAYINSLSTLNISAEDGFINNLSSLSVSATRGVFLNLSAVAAVIDNLSSTYLTATDASFYNLTANHATILDGLTADTIYTDYLHVKYPPPVNTEYLELINVNYTDVPALRVTQYGDNPVAIFYDKSGHQELNLQSVSLGGISDGVLNTRFGVAIAANKDFIRWGDSDKGQLLSLMPSTPVINNSGVNFDQVAAGGLHTVFLSAGPTSTLNTVYAAGNNTKFQVTTSSPATDIIAIIQKVGEDFSSIAAGQYHSAAIKNNGDLYTWGSNLDGQLGNGTITLTDSAADNALVKVGDGFAQVRCGNKHTLALKTDGTLWAWGDNSSGQLGTGTIFNSHIPVQIGAGIYSSISCGHNHSAAIDTSGDLYLWGEGVNGQLGNGSDAANVATPTKIDGIKFQLVSCGNKHTAAIDNSSKLFVWGSNTEGQIGDGSITNALVPTAINPSIEYKAVYAGIDCTIAITYDEDVYGWGSNDHNQLGTDLITGISDPFLIYPGQKSTTNVALYINGTEDRPGFVGIKTDKPNKELTVQGDISASGTIYGDRISTNSGYIGSLVSTDLSTDSISATYGIILNLTASNVSATEVNFNAANITNLSATSITAVDANFSTAKIVDLSATNITAVDVIFDTAKILNLSALNLTAVNAYTINTTAVHLSTLNLKADTAIFAELTATTLSTTRLSTDFAVVNFDISAKRGFFDELYVAGKQGTGGGTGTSFNGIVDGLTAEYVVITNYHEDIPALRVTQFWEQPIAIFYDVSGRPDRNFKYIASGGIEIPGTTGEAFTIALDQNNTLYRWGSNIHGQLATNVDPVIVPQATNYKFTLLDTGDAHCVGLSANKVVYTWGYNVNGQLGNRDDTFSSLNAPVSAITDCSLVAAGGNFTAAIKTDGRLFTWGSNTNGQLGVNLDPVLNLKVNIPTFVGEDYSKIACGGQHAIAIKSDGSLWAWGANNFGQVGDGTNDNKISPVLIDDTKSYKLVTCGVNHSIAIDTNDNLYAWGVNAFGQLGTGDLVSKNTPQLIGTYTSAAAGFFHTIAIDANDLLFGWGKNTSNQLISGPGTSVTTPTNIGGSQLYKFCAAGKDCTFGIDFNNTVNVLGNNDNFQIGLPIPLADTPTSLREGQVSAVNVAMYIAGSNEAPGFVGIKTDNPNKELTVRGDISASGIIYGEISATTINVDELYSTKSTLLSSHQLTSVIDNLFATNLSSASAYIESLSAASANIAGLTATSAYFDILSAKTLNADDANIITAKVSSLSVTYLTALTGVADYLTVNNDLSVKGTIFGTFDGNAKIRSLTAERILATEMLGVNVSSFDPLTSTNTNFYVSGNALVTGGLTALGERVLFDSKVSITDSLYITNPFSDTCLTVHQSGGLPVAEFLYTHAPWEQDQVALHISGYGYSLDVPSRYSGGYIGVRTRNPNEALTVRGNISASGNIYTDQGTIRSNAVSTSKLSAAAANITDLTTFTLKTSTLISDETKSGNTLATNLTATSGYITDSLVVANNVCAKEFIGSFTGTINVKNASFERLSAIDSFFDNISANNIISNNLTSTNAQLDHITAINLTAVNLSAALIRAHELFVDELESLQLSSRLLKAESAIIDNLSALKISAHNLTVDNISALTLSAQKLEISSILTNSITSLYISAAEAQFDSLKSTLISAYSITAHNIFANNISAFSVSAAEISAATAYIFQVDTPISFSKNVTVSENLYVTGDETVSGNIRCTQNVYATRFYGEVVGPIVSVGNSADLVSLSAQKGHINNLKTENLSAINGVFDFLTAKEVLMFNVTSLNLSSTNIITDKLQGTTATLSAITSNTILNTSLTSLSVYSNYLSSNLAYLNSLTCEDILAKTMSLDRLSASMLFLANTSAGVALNVTQYGPIDVARFYYNDECLTNINLQPALVIKGNGCPGSAFYNGGYVGIRTDSPGEALTVSGNVSANNLFTGLSAGIGTTNPVEALTVIGNITANNNIYASNDLKAARVDVHTVKSIDIQANSFDIVDGHILNDLTVDGNIFGNLIGSFTSSGQSNFDILTARRITAEYIQVDNLSATNTIYTPGGDSNKWNSAYNIPITINMVFNGGGIPVGPDSRSFIEVPFDMQINSWALYADVPSSYFTAVSVLSSDFNSYPTVAPIYTNVPILAPAQIKNTSTTSTWNNIIQANSILYFGICAQKLPDNSTELQSTLMTLSIRGLRK